MKSLFDPVYNREMVDRIQKINQKAQPQWGKMTVAQMVVHTQKPFQVAYEELKLKRGLIGILFGGIAKKKLVGPDPFGKNLPTARDFKVSHQPEFEKEKINLINYVQQFTIKGQAGITKEPHPFFGKMTAEEWDTLMLKHLDHHLRQFGG